MSTDGGRQVREESVAEATEAVRANGLAADGPAQAVLALQRQCGNQAVARMVAAGRLPTGRRVLQRLRFNVGSVPVDVDYSALIGVADLAAEIKTRYTGYTGAAVPAAVDSAITALSGAARRWVLYALSILQRNAAAAPSLSRADAVSRLIARAPTATTNPTGAGLDFENEVIRVSGWAEVALAAPLRAPTGTKLSEIRELFNPPTSSGSASAPLDLPKLKSELPPALKALLTSLDPASWASVGTVPLATLQTIADEIQAEARKFFAPYADTARTSPYGSGWKYSAQLYSVTAIVPDHDERIGYLLNRAEIVGRKAAPGGSIFERTNFESGRDRAELLAIVTDMEKNATTAAIVDRLIKHTGRTGRSPLRVGISTEFNLGAFSECSWRWKNIQTLCHELCHALVHPNFPAKESSVRFGQIIREGFTEVLGVELFDHVRSKATSDAAFKTRMEAGVTGTPCATPPKGTIGYGEAGPSAETIRSKVGDDNFRAAYFLGAVNLVGL
jgi:hypothetical protein